MSSKIYLIQAEGTDNYKIGITTQDPLIRLEQLQTGNSTKLFLIKEFVTKYGTKMESRLHRHFASKRVEGEWFCLEEEDVKQFNATCSKHEGNYDVLRDNPYMAKLIVNGN